MLVGNLITGKRRITSSNSAIRNCILVGNASSTSNLQITLSKELLCIGLVLREIVQSTLQCQSFPPSLDSVLRGAVELSSCSGSLSFMFTNIRSVLPKRNNMCSCIDSTDADVIILTETWLSSKVKDSKIFSCPKRYNIYRCDRTKN